MDDKLISVIVPAYNVEKTIRKCLDSIIFQTYKNIEIIVVNDCSTDNTSEILKEYSLKYTQIKVCKHEKNRGLFAARITGIKQAKGEYIGLVDSDDYISKDYYRELLVEAEDKNADIVVAKLVQENPDGYRWIQNIYENYEFGLKKGEDVWNSYWEQEGQLFIWHTVWNKLYSARIWKEALPILEKFSTHLIMCEDFVYSSILFYYAKTLSETKYSRYYYYRNENASTALNNNPKKFEKNIKDLISAFLFVKGFLESKNISLDMWKHYNRWEALYKFFWTQNILNSQLVDRDKAKLISTINEGLKSNNVPTAPNYFYSVSSEFDNRYEDIIKNIVDEKIKVVSFDVFDTALLRPFYSPTDIFELLNDEFDKLIDYRTTKFSVMRIEAETSIRKNKIYDAKTPAEDVSIKEIYDEIGRIFRIDAKILNKMLSKEIMYEKKFLRKRESIFNLYKIALHCNKNVIFTSDMYLDEETIKEFLNVNGYNQYDKIFVSSACNASKRTGMLFEHILNYYGYEGNEIVHIGDSWDSDIVVARRYKIHALFYPKTTECLEYGISDIKSTHALVGYKGRNNSIPNFEIALKYLGNRCAIAVVANYIYDMPFMSYNEWSEMNASPQFFGYFALGMHILGFTKWLYDESISNSYNQLVFIARDGYLPMEAYKIFAKYNKGCIKNIEYFYSSRKAAIPCGIGNAKDFYAVYDELGGNKIKKENIINYLSPFLKPDLLNNIEYEDNESYINNREEFNAFAEEVLIPSYDFTKADDFKKNIKKYFENIFVDKCALVDIGYSGRTQEMLSRILNRKVDAFYVHKNDDDCNERERKYGFKVNTFYDFTPSITGAQRELLFSVLKPSCVGYEIDKSSIKPCFEQVEYEYPYKYLVEEIQKYSLKFVEDFMMNFGHIIDNMYMRNVEISYPFEYMLAYIRDADMKLFDCVTFEDDMWAGKSISLSEQWKENVDYHRFLPFYEATRESGSIVSKSETNDIPLVWKLYNEKGMEHKSLLGKALFWLINDRHFFVKRLLHK